MNPGQRRGGGFTLVELLVVIAIIAVLASLLFPSLAAAREKSRTIQCLGNVRQIHIAFANYVNEHEAYPSHGYTVDDWPAWFAITNEWHSALDSNLGNWTNKNSVFRCPSYKYDQRPIYGSYGYSSQSPYSLGGFTSDPALYTLPWFTRESEIVAPAQMIEVGDAELGRFAGNDWKGWDCLQFRPNEYLIAGYPEYFQTLLKLTQNRHKGSHNIAFCDGHAELIPHLKLFAGDDENRRRWAYDHQPHRSIYDQ